MTNPDNSSVFSARPPKPLKKLVAIIGGLVLLGVSLFLGLVFLCATILFVAIMAIVVRLKTPLAASDFVSESKDRRAILEGEYVVVETKCDRSNSDEEA